MGVRVRFVRRSVGLAPATDEVEFEFEDGPLAGLLLGGLAVKHRRDRAVGGEAVEVAPASRLYLEPNSGAGLTALNKWISGEYERYQARQG